jgi:GTP cyclohydrolase I
LIPITGVAHVAYIPENRVVGISKLARTVELFSKRLQIQEKLTSQVANAINDTLKPKGVAVLIEAEHGCMTTRGVHKPGVNMVTKTLIGCFKENPDLRTEFLSLIKRPA